VYKLRNVTKEASVGKTLQGADARIVLKYSLALSVSSYQEMVNVYGSFFCSSFDWVTGWKIGVRFPAGAGIFFFATAARLALRSTQAPIQKVPGGCSSDVKLSVLETDHSPPSSTNVKNAWRYTSSPSYVSIS
jgi:hypothetical protein